MARNDTQLNTRMPISLKEKIEQSAIDNSRSVNAETIFRLEKSFEASQEGYVESLKALESFFNAHTRSERKTTVAKRLNYVLNQTQETRYGYRLSTEKVAFGIGQEYAEPVDMWFLARSEPSFSQLDLLAGYFGCYAEFLKFGDSEPYRASEFHGFDSLNKAKEWLTKPYKFFNSEKPQFVHFLRHDSEVGELVVIKQYKDWRCEVFHTNVHLSGCVGEGGARSQAMFAVLCETVYKDSSRQFPSIFSYTIDSEYYSQLMSGKFQPMVILERLHQSPWWEDLWDKSQYLKQSYWQDFTGLAMRIDDWRSSHTVD